MTAKKLFYSAYVFILMLPEFAASPTLAMEEKGKSYLTASGPSSSSLDKDARDKASPSASSSRISSALDMHNKKKDTSSFLSKSSSLDVPLVVENKNYSVSFTRWTAHGFQGLEITGLPSDILLSITQYLYSTPLLNNYSEFSSPSNEKCYDSAWCLPYYVRVESNVHDGFFRGRTAPSFKYRDGRIRAPIALEMTEEDVTYLTYLHSFFQPRRLCYLETEVQDVNGCPNMNSCIPLRLPSEISTIIVKGDSPKIYRGKKTLISNASVKFWSSQKQPLVSFLFLLTFNETEYTCTVEPTYGWGAQSNSASSSSSSPSSSSSGSSNGTSILTFLPEGSLKGDLLQP